MFEGLFRNWWFLIVFLAELNIQCLMVGYADLGSIFQTTPLTLGMHLTALGLGIGSLGVAAIAKSTGDKLLSIYPTLEEKEQEGKLPMGFEDHYQKANKVL